MKREAIGHTKMKRLCRRLDIQIWQAVGLLESIWHLTAREAPRGDIGKLSDEDIALAIDYRGDETELIGALTQSEWIDRDPVERLCIHDWHEHAEDGVHMRLARARLHFVGGHAPKLTRLPSKERDAASEFFGSCAQNGDPCARQAHDTHTASAQNGDPCADLDLDQTLTRPLPGPEAQRTSAPLAAVRSIRSKERSLPQSRILPATWDSFRNRYTESGKPLNETDWAKATMEAVSAGLTESDMTERVMPTLAAELPGWADRDIGMIPFPANWIKSQPWTRKAIPRAAPSRWSTDPMTAEESSRWKA
jgi:hypothetical protein